MPHKDKEKKAEYDKEYYQRNKVSRQEYDRLKHIKNKDKIAEVRRLYILNNPKQYKITLWKNHGMIDADWSSVYEMFIAETNCWICNHDFSKYKKCLDHNHATGELRYVVCMPCNRNVIG